MVAWKKATYGDDPTISMDPKQMNFACKIPLYESDDQGRPVVRIWDCENKITVFYSQTEYERKKANHEI